MKVYVEMSFGEFRPWAGAVKNYEVIQHAGKEKEFEQYIEEYYPNGISDYALNELLWFDFNTVAKDLKLYTYQLIEMKLIEDEEGLHEYRWYKRSDGTSLFMYDDEEPDVDSCDMEISTDGIAREWFEAYTREFKPREQEEE